MLAIGFNSAFEVLILIRNTPLITQLPHTVRRICQYVNGHVRQIRKINTSLWLVEHRTTRDWMHSRHLLWKIQSTNLFESKDVAQSRQVSFLAVPVATEWQSVIDLSPCTTSPPRIRDRCDLYCASSYLLSLVFALLCCVVLMFGSDLLWRHGRVGNRTNRGKPMFTYLNVNSEK
jgi:hypothetical protein